MPRPSDIRALRQFLDQPDTVLFVGSGLSVWSGLPDWRTLIGNLIRFAKAKGLRTRIAQEALASGQLLEAADAISLTPSEISEALRKDLGFQTMRPHQVHSLLTRLGPQRFVTTNYDSLIEQQLGLEGRLGQFRTVTGRQVAELADIVKASADRFVFKPHGDIADAESLVLSARDYERVILGERNLVRVSLETLMVTRPVLFLGFGLRDPDTALVLRTLSDRYLGNVAHYAAVMTDVTDDDRDYWWNRYRIRLYGYSTRPKKGGGADHSEFLELLSELALSSTRASKEKSDRPVPTEKSQRVKGIELHGITRDEKVHNALIRYAARIVHANPIVYPVQCELGRFGEAHWYDTDIAILNNRTIEEILDQCRTSFVLKGPAGAGKSFSITNYMSRVGRRILDWGDSPTKRPEALSIPLLLDARLYNGDFDELIEASIPVELDLEALSGTHEIVLILDSLDEMPHDHIDSGVWRSDIEELSNRFSKCRVVYGTRRAELVGRPDLPVFNVMNLSDKIVDTALKELGIDSEILSEEFLFDLSTPYLLSLGRKVMSGSPGIKNAQGLLENFVNSRIAELFHDRDVDHVRTELSRLAYKLVDAGRETIAFESAVRLLSSDSPSSFPNLEDNREVIDRLVSGGLMVSEINDHVRFVHRSLTEYLASRRIAKAIGSDNFELSKLLEKRRWDNAISWCAGDLSRDDAENFIRTMCVIDPVLAYRVIATSEVTVPALWRFFLKRIAENPPTEDQVYAMHRFNAEANPPSVVAPELRTLIGDPVTDLGGWAFVHYAPHASDDELCAWIDRLRRGDVDFNVSNLTGPALAKLLSGRIFEYFLQSLSDTRFSDENAALGTEDHREVLLRHGFCATIAELPREQLLKTIEWAGSQSNVIKDVICYSLSKRLEPEVDRFLLRQMDRGSILAIFTLYLRLSNSNLPRAARKIPRCTDRRVRTLVRKLETGAISNSRWVLAFLRTCATRNQMWAKNLAAIKSQKPVGKALKLIHPKTPKSYINSYILHVLDDPQAVSNIERCAINELYKIEIKIDEKIFLRSLKKFKRDIISIFSTLFSFHFRDHIIEVSEKHIEDWITCLSEIFPRSSWVEDHLLANVSNYLARAWSVRGRRIILDRANNPNDPEREFVLCWIIPNMFGVSTAELTDDSAILLTNLYLDGAIYYWHSPGLLATEDFISDIVLPVARMLQGDPRKRKLIEKILEDAGRRLDRRYRAPWHTR